MQYFYKIHRNIYQDAWNWWDACNSTCHNVDWSSRIDSKIAVKIINKKQKEAYNFLIPFLKEKHKKEKITLEKSKKFIFNQFEQKFDKGCKKLVEVMGKPLYRKDYCFYLTTFPSAPYDKEKGLIWIPTDRTDPISIFLHELCHFQFIHYWRENPKSAISKLSDDRFEFLKESLTMILDQDFIPIIKKPDEGYNIHQKFRKELSNFWKNEKDFDKLVRFGINKIVNYA